MKQADKAHTTSFAVLALLPDEANTTNLESAVYACGGQWIRPSRADLTFHRLNHQGEIILYDRELPGRWQQAVADLAKLPWHPSVILLSSVNDQYLWNEVVRVGGYDVLTKASGMQATIRLLRSAYSYWRNALCAQGAS